MTGDIEMIVKMALVSLPEDHTPTEEKIRETVGRLAQAFDASESEKTLILTKVLTRRLVKMDTGFALCENHTPWVDARRPAIDPFFWERLKLMLSKDWAPGVIHGLNRSTDEILDLCGNPAENDTWNRRGLVMGDVQSGKTATYSALICKAADAGYKFVILLTGTIENLRRQTQERLDQSFVGFDSSEQLKRNKRNLHVGVGLLDGRRQATVFTSSSADFRIATMEALGLSLSALKEPALVVIKKHTRILKNLCDWLQSYNTGANSGGIEIPMLMIDDEADNASINTSDEGADPTKVNAGIRELLKLFRRTTYVGFTATPFANIFVNPDSSAEMLGDDLFPRDFIYSLRAATNYFGPRRIFRDDAPNDSLHLREITDMEESLANAHKSTAEVLDLPDSLIKAMCAFFVANAIRDLRGDVKTHRSMLVHVSRFTNVQTQVEALLGLELDKFRKDIGNFSKLETEKALKNGRLRAIHDVWNEEYSTCEFDWPVIQKALRDAVLPITTKAVNQKTGPRALDYRAHRETGLRVIAVGGNSLSRGLTLEGLMISYFRRTTKMYDTLLQMGRWFGFRPGFEDLCRVWMPKNTMEWYGYISEATDELREDLHTMYRQKRTPREFGLRVRAHPDSLLVTAHNKMRTAREIIRTISLNGQSFESVDLPGSVQQLNHNFEVVEKFISEVRSRVGEGSMEYGVRVIRDVTRLEVANLLRAFVVPVTEFRFQPSQIAELLDRQEGTELDKWDVGIPRGLSETPLEVGGIQVNRQQRTMSLENPPGVWTISGDKRRVGSRGVERAGLTSEQIGKAEKAALEAAEKNALEGNKPAPEKINVSDKFYRHVRSRPLLLIHVLEGKPLDNAVIPVLRDGASLVAIGLSFPMLNQSTTQEVKYKINLVKARELFSEYAETGNDEDVEEADL